MYTHTLSSKLMLTALLLLLLISDVISRSVESSLPFFVMKSSTIINQTLHSYCQEQEEFPHQPRFINLTKWPSGLIYARNPFEDAENDGERCTVELRASTDDQIRLMFSSIVVDQRLFDEYSGEQMKYSFRSSCLTIRDIDRIRSYDCSSGSLISSSSDEDYLSSSNVLYLERLASLDLDQFEVFFVSLTRKSSITRSCPARSQFDCEDSFCLSVDARCNGREECYSKVDEQFCLTNRSRQLLIVNHLWIVLLWVIDQSLSSLFVSRLYT